jgi:hypothetical protein
MSIPNFTGTFRGRHNIVENLDVNNFTIVNHPLPTNDTDVVNKAYVDTTLNDGLYPSNNNVFVVSKSGVLGTFSTIKDAVNSANLVGDKARVSVEPGSYVEDNPIVVGSRVSVDGVDSARTVYVFPSDPTSPVFRMQAASELKGIRIDGANGVGGTGIYFDGYSVVALSIIGTCMITNCETGIHCDGSPGVIIIRDTIVTSDPNSLTKLNTGVKLSNGCDVHILDCGINGYDHVALRLDKGLVVESTASLTATNLNISGCEYGIYLDNGGKVYHNSSRFIDNLTSLYFANDTWFFQSSVNYLNSTNWDIDIQSTSNESILITSCSLDRTKINNPNDIGLKFTGFSSDPQDPAFLVLSELQVGAPNNPKEATFGSGEVYTNDMDVMTNSNEEIGEWTNISTELTFNVFSGTETGNCLYIGGPRSFPGFKCYMTTKMIPSTATVIMEYWDGVQWTEFYFFVSESDPPYYPNGNRLFDIQSPIDGSAGIETRFGRMMNWAPIDNLNGYPNLFWVRVRISSGTILTIPIIEQIQLHPNSMKINGDGFKTYYGNSRRIKNIGWDIGLVEAAFLSPVNQDVYISTNIGVGRRENSFSSNATDIISNCLAIPWDFDTSMPLQLTWYWGATDVGDVEWTVYWSYTVEDDPFYTTFNSAPPQGNNEKSYTIIETVTNGQRQRSSTVSLIFEKVISQYMDGTGGDLIWFSISRNGGSINDTNPGNAIILNLRGNYVSWTSGGYQNYLD